MKGSVRFWRRAAMPFGCLAFLLFGAAVPTAWAHKSSDSYLRLSIQGTHVVGQWMLALHDLEFAVGLDRNEDGQITWGELKGRREAVMDYAAARLRLEAGGHSVALRFAPEIQIDQLANGGFVVLRFEGTTEREPAGISVDYRVFFDVDRQHRGLALVECPGGSQEAVFNPNDTRLQFDFRRPRPWEDWWRFGREGVMHIWTGYDHVLFLIALLLPSVLRREGDRWHPVEAYKGAFLNVVQVVTAFTVAHSLTLSAAALGWVHLPSRWVETVIAASIVVAAVNNLWPWVTHRAWGIAFGFGLVHGFGFASVLADLGLPEASLVRALVGFNLGVETGQLAIVAAMLPPAFLGRASWFYRAVVVQGGSVVIALVALGWMVQRIRGG